ncbi:hypothetical protein BGW42_000614 [Actinomortierella wolfii]|nr:hypothetical protein BGW42_000614 [Actinomortierella wolfii]
MVAIVQVCAMPKLRSGVYSIAIDNLYLTAEHPPYDTATAVFLSDKLGKSSEWIILPNRDGRYQILDATGSYRLGFEYHASGSQLILTTDQVYWELYGDDNDQIQIRVPHDDLVIGILPPRIFLPQVGLTNPAKAPHSSTFKFIRSIPRTAGTSPRNVQILNDRSQLLVPDKDGQLVYVMSQGLVFNKKIAIWTIEGDDSKITIKHRLSGLYLSFDPELSHPWLKMTDNPSYFVIKKTSPDSVKVLTADEIKGERMFLGESYINGYYSQAVIVSPSESITQTWHIRDIDTNREENRLPYGKTSFW